MPEFDAPLFLDVTDDLQRVDAFMTKLVNDRSLWDDFLDDPNGVMIRLGFHPATTDEINARVNRGMWALLGDAELMTLLGDHYRTFTPERLEELQRYFLDGLSDGVIRHKLDYDYQALQHLLDDTSSLRRILRRQLVVLNEAGALEGRHTDEEIDAYVDSFLAALEARAPVRDHPKLETWDDYYGIGQDGGGQLWGEAAAAVTAFVGVQVGAYVTAVVEVGFWGVVMERSMNDAISGNEDALRAVAMMGRALDLGAEILVHAQSYRAEGGIAGFRGCSSVLGPSRSWGRTAVPPSASTAASTAIPGSHNGCLSIRSSASSGTRRPAFRRSRPSSFPAESASCWETTSIARSRWPQTSAS